ncbi:MAG: hypothetical protein GY850_23730, partial [bacterium]|nr:hypothetical protein [bacterium]
AQVNTAVAEMDKVVQQNAANAEESASASEEMNAQAEQMKSMVGDLMALVSSNSNTHDTKQATTGESHHMLVQRAHAASAKKAKSREVSVHKVNEVRPDQVIPMDDDFKDF